MSKKLEAKERKTDEAIVEGKPDGADAQLTFDAIVENPLLLARIYARQCELNEGFVPYREHLHSLLEHEPEFVFGLARAGDSEADRVIREKIAWTLRSDQTLNAAFRAYAIDVLTGSKPPARHGRKRGQTFKRDYAMAYCIYKLVHFFGLRAARNRATSLPSAASIVAAAFSEQGHNVTEAAVEKVWNASEWARYEPPLFEPWE